MSTRAMVAVGTPTAYEGRYCHSDGYPTGLGRALYENWMRFDWNLAALGEFILTSRKGWSRLAGTNFELKPRWYDYDEYDKYSEHPRWYDTRNDGSAEWIITQDDDLFDSWIEWAYFINLEANRIDVYEVLQSGFKFKGSMLMGIEPDYVALEE